jgi:hypothetical protein
MLEQIKARSIWQEEDIRGKLQRAARAKHRRDKIFVPGDIVFAWRLGGKVSGSKKEGLHRGAWFGPATVLGTESKREGDIITPTNIVWIVIGDRLWRCAPEQLRRASEREVAQRTLEQPKPWTFEQASGTLAKGNFRDF